MKNRKGTKNRGGCKNMREGFSLCLSVWKADPFEPNELKDMNKHPGSSPPPSSLLFSGKSWNEMKQKSLLCWIWGWKMWDAAFQDHNCSPQIHTQLSDCTSAELSATNTKMRGTPNDWENTQSRIHILLPCAPSSIFRTAVRNVTSLYCSDNKAYPDSDILL